MIASGSSSLLATLPASVKVSADTPVNTVLWKQSGIQIRASCVTTPEAIAKRVEATLYRAANDPQLAANGLALFVTYQGNRGSGIASFPTGTVIRSLVTPTIVSATVDIELVKTGPTPTVPTPLPPLSVLTVLIGGPGSNDESEAARFLTRGFDNISFQATTCATTTPVVAVDLGTYLVRAGSAVGSTSPARAFSIGLRCDTGIAGTFGLALRLDGSNPVDPSNGLLALTPTSTAQGVAIQVLKDDGSPLPLGTPWDVAASASASETVVVPLRARYFQLGTRVVPGTANGMATFSIDYR
ncbi:fimbrial protein [Burkholderia metallica]|uniref:fimbrial protein n=1 Tax=Burkholderia metallica TaxID=488729 RepID=UPI0015771BC9|nr:fimbrial protein [Burkholderia metallica]